MRDAARPSTRSHWLLLLPVLAVVAVYARTLGHELVWDDAQLLGSLAARPDGARFLDVVLAPLVFSPNYFRPLGTASLLVEIDVAGAIAPALHHSVNVGLHALSTLLVGLLALRLTRGSAWFGVAAAAVYGLHPALVEGVAFLSSRFDLLVTLFLLAALLADAQVERRGRRAITVGVLFFCAALSKEMAAALVLVLPLWHLSRAERPDGGSVAVAPALRAQWRTYAAVFAAGVLYLGIRAVGLSHVLPQAEPTQLPGGTLLEHTLLVSKSVGTYASLVVWPFGRLAPIHYSELPVPVGDVFAWVSLALLGVLALTVLWRRSRLGAAALLALAALVALLPVANVRTLSLGGHAFVAERFLLFPAALAALAAARRIASRVSRVPLLAAAALWFVAAAVQTVGVVGHWQDRESLWNWGLETAPFSTTPLVNLALSEVDAGRPEVGAALARRAIELDPRVPEGHSNLGIALFHVGRYQEAHDAFVAALELAPDQALTWSNLGRTLLELGRNDDAVRVLIERALPLAPDLAIVHTNLAEVYLRSDRPDLAARHLRIALPRMSAADQVWGRAQLEETDAPGRWLAMGDRLVRAKEYETALAVFAAAAERGAGENLVALGVSSTLIQLERTEQARQVLEQALVDHAADPRLHNNLGALARARGDRDAARRYFARAVELAPEWALARENLATVTD